MNILFVASECAPFVKTGGLADVIGAVPKALSALGHSVRVLIPGYPALAPQMAAGKVVMQFSDLFGGPARVVAASAEGLDLLLLDAPHLFHRKGTLYLDEAGRDHPDNHLRFGALSLAGAHVASEGVGKWRADVVNVHDWQAGLLPAYLGQMAGTQPPVVMTIHNIAFQGVFPAQTLEALKLKPALFTQDGIEYWGQISFLKAGLALSQKITTVSPSYAAEILTPEFGMGMEGLLRARADDLTGILNGIDLDVWNPETDTALPKTYSAKSQTPKAANRREVEKRFDLKGNGPLFCVVSRLTTQKGLDLLLDCLPGLVWRGARLAVLGNGEKEIEQAFISASARYRGSVGVIIGYDEGLSHLMQGGCDAILIPSRFEPCGLTQLYGLRYGTIPVVARTGGLADTIIDANHAASFANCATGFQFAPINAQLLDRAIARACEAYGNRKEWTAMVRRAMKHPVGWDQSAKAYLDVYTSAQGSA